MPELPEVETIVRELAPRIEGRHFLSVEVRHPRVVRYSTADLVTVLPGRRILNVGRRGKFILMELDHGWLTIHLGMTGQLVFDAPLSAYARVILQLDDSMLLYNDIRMFGSIEWSLEPIRTSRLGPDALSVSTLSADVTRRKCSVKALLLNQAILCGLGNIYTDEALFRAGIHPNRSARQLSVGRYRKLMQCIHDVLTEAVELRGSSVSDYVDASGRQGGFQARHQVYGKQGQPCPRCGSPIRHTVVAQRGTHYCPKCQR